MEQEQLTVIPPLDRQMFRRRIKILGVALKKLYINHTETAEDYIRLALDDVLDMPYEEKYKDFYAEATNQELWAAIRRLQFLYDAEYMIEKFTERSKKRRGQLKQYLYGNTSQEDDKS